MTKIKSSDRACFIGQTGSGKSHLAKQLGNQFQRVVIYDPKCEHTDLTEYAVAKDTKEFYNLFISQKKNKIRCAYFENKPEDFNYICHLVYLVGNTLLIADEVTFMYGKLLRYHEILIRLGRRRNAAIWHCIQRPSRINPYIISESQHYFVFTLMLKVDRDKLTGVIGETAQDANTLDKFQFIYACPEQRIIEKTSA